MKLFANGEEYVIANSKHEAVRAFLKEKYSEIEIDQMEDSNPEELWEELDVLVVR